MYLEEIIEALDTALEIFIVTVILLFTYLTAPRIFHRPDMSRFTGKIFAHRGWHGDGIPENSLAAFRKSVEKGYGMELDIQLTKDRIPVVFHDFYLSRMCGVDGNLADYNYSELREFRLGGTEEHIPTLSEVLELVDGRVPLIIEYKGADTSTTICDAAHPILSEYKGDWCMESFNPLIIRRFAKLSPEIARGFLSQKYNVSPGKEKNKYILMQRMLTNFLSRPDFIAYEHSAGNYLPLVICRKLFGAKTFAWTIRNEADYILSQKNFDSFICENIDDYKNNGAANEPQIYSST